MPARDLYHNAVKMETLERCRAIIERILDQYTQIPYAYGDIRTKAAFDCGNDRYLLVNVGWDRSRRVHGSLVHIDIIDGKIWIQQLSSSIPLHPVLTNSHPVPTGWLFVLLLLAAA